MKTITKTMAVAGIVLSTLSLQSCIVAAAMGGLGAMKYGDAKKADAETKCKKEYPNYYNSMDKINKSKSAKHEKVEPIMTLNEYCHIEPNDPPAPQKKS